jgi:hypothetical protein
VWQELGKTPSLHYLPSFLKCGLYFLINNDLRSDVFMASVKKKRRAKIAKHKRKKRRRRDRHKK